MVGRSAWQKNNLREIRKSLGRFFAIAAIIALGVGFFAGLKATPPAMLKTGSKYAEDTAMFDLRLTSSLGLRNADAEKFAALEGVEAAEGQISVDLTAQLEEAKLALRCLSLMQAVNIPVLTSGRMPEAGGECLADDCSFTREELGKTLTITSIDLDGSLNTQQLTIVGLCSTPLYLGMERGTTSLGDGTVDGFVILHPDSFAIDYFTDIYLRLKGLDHDLYSDEYETAVAQKADELTPLLENCVQEYYTQLSLYSNDLPTPSAYVLSRSSNSGYISFENDSDIVEDIGKIFPVFFFAVAALICMTTMSRMVAEQRTLIGTLKALGYSDGRITWKYMSYAGSAATLGCIAGFFLGIWVFPYTIWIGYQILYSFAPLEFYFNPLHGLVCLLASLLCSVGTTWFSCHSELRRMPASLMRPRAPKPGKRIFLERIPAIWNRFSFLWKVSLRNIIRYKKRLVMMLLGISGCTALIVAGFGLHDSISTIVDDQFGQITHYQISVSFAQPMDASQQAVFRERFSEQVRRAVFSYTAAYEVRGTHGISTLHLIVTDDPDITQLIVLNNSDGRVAFPEQGAVIDTNLAEILGVSSGDSIAVHVDDARTVSLPICENFDNYVYHYALMNTATYEAAFGAPCRSNTAYLVTTGDPFALSAELSATEGIVSVTVMESMREIVNSTLDGVSYIIAVIIFSACALAMVVLFNLCNISITERVREIATVKVLGFRPYETQTYVFREVLLLTVLGALLGLPLGFALHRFVMKNIVIDMVSFNNHVAPLSYLLSFGITIFVGVLVCLLLMRKIDRIHMADSLKSVE